MTTFRIGDIVTVKKDMEIAPLCYAKEGELGVIIDKTTLDYYRVKFLDLKLEWIQGKDLKRVENQ